MARGKGRPFKPGNCANPGGRPKTDPLIKEFKETSYKDFINQLQKYGSFTEAQMQADLTRKDATVFEIIFGKILQGAMNGDKDSRQVLLERLWGKVKDQVVHSAEDMNKPQIIVSLPDNGRMAPDND